jgi:hypothetical protein
MACKVVRDVRAAKGIGFEPDLEADLDEAELDDRRPVFFTGAADRPLRNG